MTPDSGAPHGCLASRYRRLLLTYPRSYRRQRGAEIVTTLLDAAPADQTRPTRRESVDLLAGGIRHRFRVIGAPGVVTAYVIPFNPLQAPPPWLGFRYIGTQPLAYVGGLVFIIGLAMALLARPQSTAHQLTDRAHLGRGRL